MGIIVCLLFARLGLLPMISSLPPAPGPTEDYSNLYKDENSYSKPPSANLINVVNQDVTRCCLGITS